MSVAANTIVYAFRTHDRVVGRTDAKSRPIAVNATNKIVVSRNTANTARLVTASTAHGGATGRGGTTDCDGERATTDALVRGGRASITIVIL